MTAAIRIRLNMPLLFFMIFHSFLLRFYVLSSHDALFSRLIGKSRFYHDRALYTLAFHLTAHFVCIIDRVVELI